MFECLAVNPGTSSPNIPLIIYYHYNNSEIGSHVWSKIGDLTCLRLFFRSTAAKNIKSPFWKYMFSFTRVQSYSSAINIKHITLFNQYYECGIMYFFCFNRANHNCIFTKVRGFVITILPKIFGFTECPQIYSKSVLHLLKYKFAVFLSRCCTDLR